MRTDSVHLSQKALQDAQKTIESKYGKEFFQSRTFSKKQKGAQEAHEAIRPTEVSRTPKEVFEYAKTKLDPDARKLYELIWKRTLASQMADAKLLQTGIDFEVLGKSGAKKSHIFRSTGQRVIFSGFLKVYAEGRDDDVNENEENILPEMKKDEEIKPKKIEKKQHFTKPPARYTEASLVKKMEAEGIGRPSTYAPTITTIMGRGYVIKEGRQLQPTDTAFVVTDFLAKHFSDIVSLKFTADMEEKLDDISEKKVDWVQFMKDFYGPFSKKIKEGDNISRAEATKSRMLGSCPATGLPIYAKLGKFGAMLQKGETESDDKPTFAPILKDQSLESITLQEAIHNFQLPRTLGKGKDGEDIVVSVGRFGPYIRHEKTFVSIEEDVLFSISLEEAQEKLQEKEKMNKNKIIHDFVKEGIQVLNGQYGPYISTGKKNVKIPKDTDPKKLTLSQCQKLIAEAPEKKGRWKRK